MEVRFPQVRKMEKTEMEEVQARCDQMLATSQHAFQEKLSSQVRKILNFSSVNRIHPSHL